ncbi:class I SAM-dependent DNA methyltransferase [Xanthomonas albilineans]|uniref:class I SAM-dependent DNA methyltransferase n=1 Tax=Xanthomonas albilineans TaxID=29447 RepID=UPI0005F30D71|nr:class I SAM-dependent methyltransferase [Xanthomonas albilineans]
MHATSEEAYNRIAQYYDWLRDVLWNSANTPQCVRTLAALVSTGTALELGVGTGRIALPLAASGATVCGIDNSQAMLDKLRVKSGAERLRLVCGNFVDVPVAGAFDLIYSVFSFGYLLEQNEQVCCLAAVRERLSDSGVFVIQTAVPQAEMLQAGGKVSSVLEVPPLDDEGDTPVVLLCSSADPLRQLVQQRIVVMTESGTHIFKDRYRYVWPSELDLMARLAGLELKERWSDWTQQPIGARARSLISIYRRAGSA